MSGKTALVTGADRGVGHALVKALLQQGWHVFAGCYASPSAEMQTLQQQYGTRLYPVSMDVGREESVNAAAEEVKSHADRLDLLINNAGILGDIEATLYDELDFAEMQNVWNVNTLGPLRVTHAFIRLLLKGDRLLANISSEAGSIGQCFRHNWYGYCMSKSALNMQSALVYNQFKADGLKVMLLHPGWVQSYMQGELDTKAKLTADQAAANILQVISRYEQLEGADGRPPYIHTETGETLPW